MRNWNKTRNCSFSPALNQNSVLQSIQPQCTITPFPTKMPGLAWPTLVQLEPSSSLTCFTYIEQSKQTNKAWISEDFQTSEICWALTPESFFVFHIHLLGATWPIPSARFFLGLPRILWSPEASLFGNFWIHRPSLTPSLFIPCNLSRVSLNTEVSIALVFLLCLKVYFSLLMCMIASVCNCICVPRSCLVSSED